MGRECACVHFDNGKCKKFSDDEVTSWCIEGPCEDRTPSNADRIRDMSDRDLAEFLSGKFAEVGYLRLNEEGHKLTKTQVEAIKYNLFGVFMKWLKQPAEG